VSKEKKPTKPSLNKNTLKTAKRLLGYVTKTYKVQFIIVLICILVSSIATISVSLSLKFLLDDYIIPLIGQKKSGLHRTVSGAWYIGMYFLERRNCLLHLHETYGRDRAGRAETCPRRDV